MPMKAIALHDFESGPAASELPTPEPGNDELLVRVLGSSVNGFDVAVASGMLKGMMEYRFPVVLGTDFAGTVEQVGAGVSRYRAGDEVFGIQLAQGTLHDGTWAEYLVVAQDAFVARKPSTLDFTRSGALPLAGLTALHAVDAVDPEEGETVLIAGASGGVGGYAVQLAAQRGATVIATARADDADRLVRLGATETIDFSSADVATAVRERRHEGVDALIDLVHEADGLATLAGPVRAWPRSSRRDDSRSRSSRYTRSTRRPQRSRPSVRGSAASSRSRSNGEPLQAACAFGAVHRGLPPCA
jgi:NADPH2:quinone reductase